jgi:hypothetical protein
MDEESLKKLKVTELKALLQERNLTVVGKKEELIQRLLSHEEQPSQKPKEAEEESFIPLKSESSAIKDTKSPKVPPPIKTDSNGTKAVEDDSVANRRARFGTTTIDDQINARRARFGSSDESKSASPSSTPVSTPSSIHSTVRTEETDNGLIIRSGKGKQTMEMVIGMDEVDRIKARQARFGTNAPILSQLESSEKISERKRRFSADPQTKPV